MQLSSWLKSFGQNPRRPRTNGLPTTAERMEDRSLLSVAALYVGGELFISSDGGDSIAVRQNTNGRVEVLANGSILGTAPNVTTASVTSIVIKGGDEANNINLNEVTNTTYPAITSIRVEGDDGDDTIVGSPTYGDSLLGGDGRDTIDGQAGNDTLDGGDGNDLINGRDGDDSLIGEDGNDSITGDNGNDTISGGNHLDTITGGDGDDSIDAGHNNDSVNGNLGNDTINGSDGSDVLNGDDGDDSILGGALNDTMSGGIGNDILIGQAGNDAVNGDDGSDSVDGGTGNDSVSGGLGNDLASGGSGNDSVFGNEGDDTLFGGAGQDTLDGFLGNDRIFGQGGSDTLLGGGGADSLDGGAGEDTVDSADPIPEAAPLAVSVTGSSVVEGDSGTSVLTFALTLSQSSFLPISVNVSTADGSAVLGTDYAAVNQVFTFAPGQTTGTVSVTVTSDTTNEVDETVRLVLSNPTNGARLLNLEATGTITNDDAPPNVLFGATFQGDLYQINQSSGVGTLLASMPVGAVHDIVQVGGGNLIGYTQNGPQLFRIDPRTGGINFVANVNGLPAGINIEGDMAFDPVTNSLYYVYFSAAGNPNLFRIDTNTGAATDLGEILVGTGNLAGNNDNVEMDYLAFGNGVLYAVFPAGITGNNATFNDSLITINPATRVATRVGPLNVDLTPIAGGLEYDATNNEVLLLDGSTANLYRVNVANGGATLIGNTGMPATLVDAPTGLSFAPVAAVQPRTVLVGNATFIEGDQGTQTVAFQISAQPGAGNVTVNYQTADGTATAGSDYVSTFGSLTFGPAGGVQIVSVIVNGDFAFESNESFFLQLTSVAGAVVSSGTGTATINNDDTAPLGDTLLGNTGNDTIHGGPAADFINADGGIDVVNGNGGNDTILGGVGPDTLNGGEGNDVIEGQGGDDVIDGGNGDDIAIWRGDGDGNDTISNASGADGVLVQLTGASNVATVGQALGLMTITEGGSTLTVDDSVTQVTVDGGAGDDTIGVTNIDQVIRGSLTVRGGTGDDFVTAQTALIGVVRVRIEGGAGNDTLFGSEGGDTILGDAGVDRIRGFGGNDSILGGADVDWCNGEEGNDTIIGGDGTDSPTSGDLFDILNGDAGDDSLRGELGNDTLIGGDGNDTVRGGDGNDSITGDAGNDSLLGDTASDSINGGDGDDTLDGGRNNDVLNGMAGNDKIRGDHGDDTIAGGAGNDTVNGGDGDDVINGQSGADLMTGADGDDTINGAGGNDTITGGDGDDVITGGDGNDIILGEQGDDQISGNSSTDTLAGGQGDDTLVAAAAGEIDELFTLSSALLSALNAT